MENKEKIKGSIDKKLVKLTGKYFAIMCALWGYYLFAGMFASPTFTYAQF